MRDMAIAYVSALIVFGVLDYLWLHTTADVIYRRALSEVFATDVNMKAAMAFYFIHIIGIVFFCVSPALTANDWLMALTRGALFGFFVYTAYDMTNLATLKVWSLKVSLIDMAWGSFVTAMSAAGSAWIVLLVKKQAE